MRWSRAKKFDYFYSLRMSQQSVLDVGISPNTCSENVNVFMKRFRGADSSFTGLAVKNIDDIARLNPGKSFCQYGGGTFPFKDNAFDWVFSNAVIEHVGRRKEQVLFLQEMCRVSRHVFFTTPNKYFPVESHTNTFFRHWSSTHFYRWCQENQPHWSEKNLFLMSKEYLIGILKEAGVKNYTIHANRVLGWPMTFTVVIT